MLSGTLFNPSLRNNRNLLAAVDVVERRDIERDDAQASPGCHIQPIG